MNLNFSSYYSYSDSERLNNNIQEISKFPDDKNAQIKANTYGTLGRADGNLLGIKGANWAFNALATQVGLASEITDTAKVIEKTFGDVSAQFEKNFQEAKDKNLSGRPPVEDAIKAKVLSDYQSGTFSARQIAERHGLGRSTVFKIVKEAPSNPMGRK